MRVKTAKQGEVLGTLTLVPNREQGPAGYTRTVSYEARAVQDVPDGYTGERARDEGFDPPGVRVVPVYREREWRDGKFKVVRISEGARPPGLRGREWPQLHPDVRFAPEGAPIHETPEPTWLRIARLEALVKAGQIRCGRCGLTKKDFLRPVLSADWPAYAVEFHVCTCPALDMRINRAHIVRAQESNAVARHDHGPYKGTGGTDGRNDLQARRDARARKNSRAVEAAPREHRSGAGEEEGGRQVQGALRRRSYR